MRTTRMRRATGFILALAAAGACGDATQPPTPEPPDLVFWDPDREMIVGVRLDEPWNVIDLAEGRHPAWSPDGSRIAFATCCAPDPYDGALAIPNGIVVMNPVSGQVQRLSDEGGRPAWSPDGTRIAFERIEVVDGHAYGSIWLMNADASGPVELAAVGVAPAWASPSWSPDGTRLVVVSLRPGAPQGLYVVDAGGGAAHLGLALEAAWSPAPGRLLFARSLPGVIIDLFTMASDGGDTVRVTTSPPDYRWSREGAWSPDGTRITFARLPEDESPTGTWNVYVANADGTEATRIAEAGRWPSWSPDGGMIAFVRARRMRVIHLDTGLSTDLGPGVWPASWRPAGGGP